jgi:alpha-mannosidase
VDGLPVGLGALKALEDGGGLLLRVYEPQGARGRLTVRAPAGWRLARALDLLERDAGAPALELGPFAVRSYQLVGFDGV